MRFLVPLTLALALGAPAAHATRRLTPAESQQVLAIARKAKAKRVAKEERRRAAKAEQKRVREAKFQAALRYGARYKADKARRKAEADAAREREAREKNSARLRFVESLLRGR